MHPHQDKRVWIQYVLKRSVLNLKTKSKKSIKPAQEKIEGSAIRNNSRNKTVIKKHRNGHVHF